MNDIKKLDYNFDIIPLVDEVMDIVNAVGLHKHHSQISLKHTGNEKYGDFWYQGCGSLTYKFGENFIDKDGNLLENDIKLEQSDFSVLNSALGGTYLEDVISTIETHYDIGRIRIMGLAHKKVMSMHVDKTKRIHIPLVTNENCLMIIDNQLYNMPADGFAYLTDVTKPHTALNANHNFMRYHLLFDLKS